MTTDRRSTYADRAAHFDALAVTARTASDTDQAAHLEAMAQRARKAHEDRAWRHAEGLIYDHDECCIECTEHISDPTTLAASMPTPPTPPPDPRTDD